MSSKRTRWRKREAWSVGAAVWESARYYPIAMCRDVDTEMSCGTFQKHVWRAWDEDPFQHRVLEPVAPNSIPKRP